MILLFLLQESQQPINFADWKSVALQLGVGVFIAFPFAFLWWDERKQRKDLEKLLIEKLSSLVIESTNALEKVKEGFDLTVDKIAEKSSRMDLDKALRRVEMVADELNDLRKAKERDSDL